MHFLSDRLPSRALVRRPTQATHGLRAWRGRLTVTALCVALASSVPGRLAGAAPSTTHAPPPAWIILHQDDQRLYFEIPRRTLDTEVRVQCTAETIGAGRRQTHDVSCNDGRSGTSRGALADEAEWHLTRRGDTVLVVGRTVLARLPIRRFGPDSAPVIDVSPLFFGAAGPHAKLRSAQTRSRSVEVTLAQPSGTSTVVRHWSLLQLPSRPIPTGRDTVNLAGRATGNLFIPSVGCIRRLEKRDPWATSSDVVHPIVYYVDPHTPKQWVPYVKHGLEEWTPAFDAIGLRHAIVVREVPGPAGPAQDSAWARLNDGHHDVVRWQGGYVVAPAIGLTSAPIRWTVAGVTVADTGIARVPRYWAVDISNETGADCDTKEAGVMIPAPITLNEGSVLWFQRDLFFGSPVALDPTVRHAGRLDGAIQCPVPLGLADFGAHCPVPDSLLGPIVQMLAAHEMGHALGLGHNFTGRLTYPADSLHSRSFVERMGITPTVMDYAGVNYFAQPADDMPFHDLLKSVGPYDRWIIAWLYRPIPGAYTIASEMPTLMRWRAALDTAPYLRGSDDGGDDDILGSDQLQGAEMRVRTLARLATHLDLWQEQSSILELWIGALRDASYGGEQLRDSARITTLAQFYLDHLVLRRDPLLQAAGITWSTVPPGWDLSLWRWRQTTFIQALFKMIQSLAAPTSPPSSVHLGVCHVLRTTLAAMTPASGPPAPPRMLDTASQAHTDSLRGQLEAIATQATCPALGPDDKKPGPR